MVNVIDDFMGHVPPVFLVKDNATHSIGGARHQSTQTLPKLTHAGATDRILCIIGINGGYTKRPTE